MGFRKWIFNLAFNIKQKTPMKKTIVFLAIISAFALSAKTEVNAMQNDNPICGNGICCAAGGGGYVCWKVQ